MRLHTRHILLATAVYLGAVLPSAAISVVDTDLGAEFERIFPELSEGYIDLNSNDKLDRLEDMDELVPESLIQDDILQVQEILDFVIEQYRFFSLDTLQEIDAVLEDTSGDIPEIIALSYSNSLQSVIEKKREFGGGELYLTPSALERAHKEMNGYIATMLHAFKKEEPEYAEQFSEAREKLFSMMEAGYPLPELGDEDKRLLSGAMIQTILNTGEDNPKRVRAAVSTLGRMGSEQAIPYLEDLLDSETYRSSAARALGQIGNNRARSTLMNALGSTETGEFQNALIRAIGNIGGDSAVEKLLAMAEEIKSAEGETTPARQEKMLTVLQAMADITEKGKRDRRIYNTVVEYLEHERPEFRQAAVEGVAAYGGRNAVSELRPMLQEEKNERVLISLVENLNSLGDPSVVPAFTNLLGISGTSTRVKVETIRAIGENEHGARAVTSIMDYLSASSEELRDVTAEAISTLYEEESKTVIGGLTRGVVQSDDELFLKEATGLLAELADEDSLGTLLKLVESPYPEVRKNVTWGLYRIRPQGNTRVVGELQKLVTSQTEPLEVRINAVRALGAIGIDSDRLDVEKTLTTSLKLNAPEYAMLRYYSIRSLADLPGLREETLKELERTASSREPLLVRTAALETLRKNGNPTEKRASVVAGIAKRSEEPELRLAALKLLGDYGAAQAVSVARLILDGEPSSDTLMQTSYALSRVKSEEALSLLINIAAREEMRDYTMGILTDADPALLEQVVRRRTKTEKDQQIRSVLQILQSEVSLQ